MITDKIENIHLYPSPGERISKALEYLKNTDFSKFPAGKYEIDGTNIYSMVSEYNTKDVSEGKLEAHKKYIDVQYIAKGKELIGFVPFNNQEVVSPYDEEKDYHLFKSDVSFIKMEEGMFAIFFPSDLHMPGIKDGSVTGVKKVVVKVRV